MRSYELVIVCPAIGNPRLAIASPFVNMGNEKRIVVSNGDAESHHEGDIIP